MRGPHFIFIVALAIACNESGDSFSPELELHGTWKFSEEGFSPGSGYFIKQITDDPPHTINFYGERQFSSTLPFLADYKYFRVIQRDPQMEVQQLWLYKTDPDPMKEPEPSRLMYFFGFEGNLLKLYPAFPSRCIEGCHLGFKR